MRAIFTKIIPATDNKGYRIEAKSHKIKVRIPFPYLDRDYENHQEAVRALCNKFGWQGDLIGGHTSEGMVWVFNHEHSPSLTV